MFYTIAHKSREDWSGDNPQFSVRDMELEGAAKQTHPEGDEKRGLDVQLE